MDESRYTNVTLEDIREQMRAVLEITAGMQEQIADLPRRDEFNELKDDVKTIKQAVIDTSRDLRLLERRVTKLEKAA